MEGKAHQDHYKAGVLLFTQRNLFGCAESLAADAFVNLLDLATGLQECGDLRIDRITGFNGGSWLYFAGGCFYTHGGYSPVENNLASDSN